jgi:pimeloyl-ACP methyl ester carboxylesterase
MCALDLWGRGYSDTPEDVPQDMRLFSYAIFLALASSDLCWTGISSFSIVGYSLGGGIATNFTSFFPQFISHLVLIAPSGLVRKEHISRTSKVLYSTGLLPGLLIERFVAKRLGNNPSAAVAVKSKPTTPTSMAMEEELPSQEQAHKDSTNVLSEIRPEIAARDAVVSRWDLFICTRFRITC